MTDASPRNVQLHDSLAGDAVFFLAAHRAFIIADNFLRMAALIGLRPAVFLEPAVPFLGPLLPFCFAHQAFFAAAILARAAALIRRRFRPPAGLAWFAIRSQVIDALEAQEIKETGNEEE